MTTSKTTSVEKPLACGGRGPCCHVGYAHRHCEHCDAVIPIYQWPPLASQPYRLSSSFGPTSLGNASIGFGQPIEATLKDASPSGHQSTAV